MTDPACWSWPVPAWRDHGAELAALAARGDLSAGAWRLIYRDAAALRWAEFHAGVRVADDPDAAPRCAMCGTGGLREGGATRVVDDHDHTTGLIRGILCSGCNVAEGIGRRDVAAAYAARPPSLILGYRSWYVGRGWPLGWWNDPGLARRLTGNRDWARDT